jgi:hypothetical protein
VRQLPHVGFKIAAKPVISRNVTSNLLDKHPAGQTHWRVKNMTISCRRQGKNTPGVLYLIEKRTPSNG